MLTPRIQRACLGSATVLDHVQPQYIPGEIPAVLDKYPFVSMSTQECSLAAPSTSRNGIRVQNGHPIP